MPSVFIIVETDPIVSMDLTGILSSAYQDSKIHVVPDLTVARGLAVRGAGTCVIASGNQASNDPSEFLNKLASTGASVVCLGKPDDFGFPCVSVDVPFKAEMIIDAVASAASGQTGHRPPVHT